MAITALVVDDEPRARAFLTRLLEADDVVVVGEAGDGASALREAQTLQPDLMFLDIEMPELNGMELADCLVRLPKAPLIVFVTGYSEHALAAFDRDALDYLQKPVSRKRLAQTLARARSRLGDPALREAAAIEIAAKAEAEPRRLARLPIRDDYMIHLLRVEEIVFAEARDRRVYVHTTSNEYKTWFTLKYLEDHLPEERFFRIHDTYIANIEQIEDLLFLGNHTYEIRLTDNRRLPVGRTRYAELQRRLGVE